MPTRTPCTGERNGDPSFLIWLNWPDGTWPCQRRVLLVSCRQTFLGGGPGCYSEEKQEDVSDDVMIMD